MTGNSFISRSLFLGLLATVLLVACTKATEQATSSEDRVDLKSVRVDDTTLHFIEHGEGTPVVFVHGSLGDYRTWDGQIEAFSEKYRVISYSRRYYYPNEYPQDTVVFPRADHVADLKDFLDALDIRPVHLVGHSGGGATSLLFARDYPDYLISLTLGEPAVTALLATTPEGVSTRQWFDETVVEPSTSAFQAGDDEEGVRLFINGVMGGENSFDNLPSKFRQGMLQNAYTMRSSRLDTTSRPRPRPSFSCEDGGRIRMPTFLIHGELSPKMFVLINDMLEPCLPNVERAMLKSASHGLEMENPGDFNEIVLEFIERHQDVWEPFAGALANTQRRNLTSEITGRTYQISVALPEDYATSDNMYPVLYAVDANIQFGTVVETAREQHQFGIIPELIIVGIGYPVDRYAESQELRQGDICGRGDRDGFLTFIREELIPLVESEFRADSLNRAFYGHSCGGGFALHALFKGDGTFEHFIAGSPGTRTALKLESDYTENHDSLPAQLFISTGLLLDEPFPENPSNIRELVNILESRKYDGLQIKTAYIEDETHITVIPATIGRGLRAIYEDFSGGESQ